MAIRSDSDVSIRLERLEDLQAINRLFTDYGHYLDERDWPKLAALFAEDGEVILEPLGRATGPSAIRSLLEGGLSSERGRTFHIISNPLVTLTGESAETNVSWAMIVRHADDRPTLAAFGRHRDRLVPRPCRPRSRTTGLRNGNSAGFCRDADGVIGGALYGMGGESQPVIKVARLCAARTGDASSELQPQLADAGAAGQLREGFRPLSEFVDGWLDGR